MKSSSFFFSLVLLLSATFISCNDSTKTVSGEVPLKFNLQKGKSYDYSIIMDMENEMQGGKMNSKMQFDYMMDVIDENKGIKTIKTTYSRILMDMKSPQGGIEFDTDKTRVGDSAGFNPMNMMQSMFYALKGKSFQMKVDETGKITEVTGAKEMADAMINSMNLPENMKSQVGAAFKLQFNDEKIKSGFEQALNIYPNKPVKVGDKWNKKFTTEMAMMNMNSNTTYTVKEIKGNRVTLGTDAILEMSNGKGSQTGTMVVDANSGMVIDADLDQTLTGNINTKTKIKIKGEQN